MTEYYVEREVFYKNIPKETLLILCDTELSFRDYKKISRGYSDEIADLVDAIDMKTEYDKYEQGIEKLGVILESKLESFIEKRLERFDITYQGIIDYFNATITMTREDMKGTYLLPIGEEEDDEEKDEETPEGCTPAINRKPHPEENVGLKRALQMVYLSGMINKLNPKRIEFDIPEDIFYEGPIGYNLNFDGELVINGNVDKFGRGLVKADITINGKVREMNLHSPDIAVTVNGDVTSLRAYECNKVEVNGDIHEAYLNEYYNDFKVDGNIVEGFYYFPIEKRNISEEEKKKGLGVHFEKYQKFERNSPQITGNLSLCFPYEEGTIEDIYSIVEYIDVKGKVSIIPQQHSGGYVGATVQGFSMEDIHKKFIGFKDSMR